VTASCSGVNSVSRKGSSRSPQWIRNYGCAGATIVPLPDEAWAGMSDLSLGATVTESGGGIVVVIDDIRVL
jgi:hypothetical protein